MMLKIRGPREEGDNFIKAYLAMPDGSESVLIATLHVLVADRYPEAFQQWQDLLTDIIKKDLEAMGLPVSHFETFKPHDKD
jgi:hypothetical protein